jgi:hypothetical protein
MSRKNRLTLTQLLDKMNIKGDKVFQQFADSQKRKAESLIHALTVKGDEATRGEFKGKKLLDIVSDISNVIPFFGKGIDLAIDAYTAKRQDDFIKQQTEDFRKKTLANYGSDYKKYKASGLGALLSQVEQANRLRQQEVVDKLIKSGVSFGFKTGVPQKAIGKLGDTIEKSGIVKDLEKQFGLDSGSFFEAATDALPIQFNPAMDYVPFGTRTFKPGVQAALTQAGWKPGDKSWDISNVSKVHGPSLRDYLNMVNPLFKKKKLKRGVSTYPGIGSSRTPSLRRKL